MARWIIVSEVFRSEQTANAAIESVGEALGGLHCRPAAGRDAKPLALHGGWIGSIEVSPEMASFAFGILRGWADSEPMQPGELTTTEAAEQDREVKT